MNGRKLAFAAFLVTFVFTYQNCSKVNFSQAPLDSSNQVNNTNTPNSPKGGPGIVLETIKPAMAVRGMSCLMCHTQINSNIITDFGYGDPQFFVNQMAGTLYGQNAVFDDKKPLTLPWYGNYYGTWQLADKINGTVYVPRVQLTDTRLLTSIGQTGPSVSLASLLGMDLGAAYYGDAPYTGAGALTSVVTPAAGNSKVQEVSQVYIGAPTVSQLLGLTKTLTAANVGWEAVGANSQISGLVVANGTGGTYVTNSGSTLKCLGDVVVSGTLFLNNVTIDTDNGGCRLMATQTVFIQGQVLYTSTSGTQNLQVSSARAIMMGFDTVSKNSYGQVAITGRLSAFYPDAQPLTRGTGTNSQKNGAILAEANVLGSVLHDSTDPAGCPTTMVTYTGYNGGGSKTQLTQCSINFTRLLLNAPNVESRYIGQVNGVVIAEIALFAPGALNFAYDPTFDKVDVLPLLGSSVLSITQ